MPIPMNPVLQNFGEKPGQRTSAGFLQRVQQELIAGRVGVDLPLTLDSGPSGDIIGLDRLTLDLLPFKLTATLKAGSSATANLLSFDGQSYSGVSEEITVYDGLGQDDGSIVGRSGDFGLCKWQPGAGRFEIVRNALLGAGEDFFPAEILTRTLSSGVYKYGWRELEFATKAALPTTLSSGRSGDNSSNQPAIEINNQKVKVGAFVWMRRGYRGARATASFTQTTSGNNMGIASAFSLYVDSATGGTYTLTLNSGTTTALAYNANSATVKSALETASGKTLSSFSGAGTLASPWTFSVSTDTANYFCSADGSALDDDSSYAFAAPAGTARIYEWTAIKTADYTADAWEAVPVDYSGGDVIIRLPASPTVGDRVLIVKLGFGYHSATKFVKVHAPGNGVNTLGENLLNGAVSTVEDLGYRSANEYYDDGYWEFVFSGVAGVGWVVSRILQGPPIVPVDTSITTAMLLGGM